MSVNVFLREAVNQHRSLDVIGRRGLNVLSSAATRSPGLLNGLARAGMQEPLLPGLVSHTSLDHLGDPDETTAAAPVLASEESSSTNAPVAPASRP
jgi:hypothetical protein